MIGFLRGEIFALEEQKVLIDVGNIGYEVYMIIPEILSLKEGDKVMIFTYYHQKEDSISIFGFLNKKLKEVFELLNSVSGLGPKTVIGILSKVSVDEILDGIYQGDVLALTKMPGIGNKIAGRIILELQDKLEERNMDSKNISATSLENKDLVKDAEAALVFLGYSKKEINEILGKILKRNRDSFDLDSLIKEALKELSKS